MMAVDKDGGIWFDRGNASSYNNENIDYMLYYRYPDGKEKGVLTSPKHLKNLTVTPLDNFCKFSDSISYMPCLQPVIFDLQSDNIKIKYELDFNGAWPPDNFLTLNNGESIPNVISRLMESEYIMNLCFLENSDWLQLTFTSTDKLYLYFYNKLTSRNKLLYTDYEDFGYPIAIENNNLYVTTPNDGEICIYNLKNLHL